jgi:endonuclease G, mitochondrial
MKIPVELLDKAEKEYPKPPEAVREIREVIARESVIELDGVEHVERRRTMIAATALENVSDAFERYLGTNDLLPINYLLGGYLQSKSVGRIRYFDKREGKIAWATGFMISPELMLTNHHVFPVADQVEFAALIDDPAIEFGYEFDIDGRQGRPVVFDLDPRTFLHTSRALDMALVAVAQTDRSGSHRMAEQGYLVLNGNLGKTGLGDYATIIQHPEGRDKQIALRNNEIIDTSLPDALIYKSDTSHGSSGAPVFNNEWQVIALHSAGVAKKNIAGDYIDQNDQVIEKVNGKIDADRIVWLSNRGTRVSAIVNHLRTEFAGSSVHPMVETLFGPAYTDSRPFISLSRPSGEREVHVNAPTAAPLAVVQPTGCGPIDIHITIGREGVPTVTSTRGALLSPATALLLDEEKKYEDELDFSGCDGYQDDFMSVRIPMPLPGTALRRKLAFRVDSPSSYTLKYFHYSTIQHAVRRVAAISAINVHGKYRYAALGSESRKDKWFRDNRLDYDAQLDDDWYEKSGFDRGHLARREDAEWGTSIAKAKLAADLTCSYANAIPQVPALNRAIMGYRGVWGQLEAKLLEAGVRGEAGRSARICVFSGPLFEDDDPVYKSVQVALKCFKVVAWLDGAGNLRCTSFRLSQEQLVGEIDFEVLRFDEVFRTYQCPLREIELATGLVFPEILRGADTSRGGTDVVDERALERLVGGDWDRAPRRRQ